ncbi:hypothetical protein LEP1GSC193_1477 [Leptospira alstonii serovar Pingchang str. 80-412]|uniref:Uncharacterized protein n=2 Tax=Leptospira alstonii TaxID=28452 RepID=T0FP04_9LEPT|nr:hypothetical protein LEP1GSC194_1493 [Leptospira alstonii serovar Sichuan str. 79601]EQA79455.1 hypothetical protein LEP1GSC193_0432 [Leptospira alstonii serovar Pingchang str. 80-412]EQA81801.1 hypothetical protein LEP1GSC193_1477 [Leptospira alstonii serovar Pingchang str. 80-412]
MKFASDSPKLSTVEFAFFKREVLREFLHFRILGRTLKFAAHNRSSV